MKFGSQSEVDQIKSLLLKHPKDAFICQDNIQSQWKELNYLASPDYDKALKEYDNLVEYLTKSIPEIYYLPQKDKTGLDSIYVHDSVVITNKGTILCNMGKEKRRGEPRAAGEFLLKLGIPILGSITGEGKLEGGDVVWIDERTVAVGLGLRTNEEGIRQLKEFTRDIVDEFIAVPLPHWKGPGDVLHLMSLISPVDHDLAVVFSRLLPVRFREWLQRRGIQLLEVPDSEFETMACNILAVAPRKCIMLSGNPQTKQILENKGIEVWEYGGEEISKKGAGGPTCLTRPLLRERI
ncbi:MAG: amidinotransferase [Candidatus Aminicenantes bacterium]|nr:amidinotransferase [Candidatus Aminicenantes bacterium]